jgi:hypothetical protein
MKDKMTAQFDIIVDEAPTSVNMQERTWAFLKEIIPMAESMGVPIPPTVLEYAPIPSQLAADWQKLLQPDPKAQELQNRAKEAEVAESEAKAKLSLSRAAESDLRPQLAALESQMENMRQHHQQQADSAQASVDALVKQAVAKATTESAERIAALDAAVKLVIAGMQKEAAETAASQDTIEASVQ